MPNQNPITHQMLTDDTHILQVKEICKSFIFTIPENHLQKFRVKDNYKLDFSNQLRRGTLIEDVLVHKILWLNKSKSLYKIEGKFRGKENNFLVRGYNRPLPTEKSQTQLNLLRQIISQNYFPLSVSYFESKEVKFKSKKIFKAKKRCMVKPSIDYCFIDIIIDHTIIDIKTDLNSKSLKRYIKQVIIQSIMFSSFLKATKTFTETFARREIDMINLPIESVGIYYWRTNEFYKYKITDFISVTKFKKLVSIYSSLRASSRTKMRLVIKESLFEKT